jgi:hypothetical protein
MSVFTQSGPVAACRNLEKQTFNVVAQRHPFSGVPRSAVLRRFCCEQNLVNAFIINLGSAFGRAFRHACLGDRFPYFAVHNVPTYRTNDFPPTVCCRPFRLAVPE